MSQRQKKQPQTPNIFKPRDKPAPSPPSPQDSSIQDSETELPHPTLSEITTHIKLTLQTEIRSLVSELRSEITSLGTRTDSLEKKTDELCVYQSQTEEDLLAIRSELDTLKDQLEDQENRSRRNNIRIKNIPESISAADLPTYLEGLFKQLIPTATSTELLLDRAHRALRTKPASGQPPRDVVTRLHYFTIKERIMQASRSTSPISFQGSSLHIFQDLAPSTLKKRREFIDLTQALRDNNIRYRWGFPFQLIFSHSGKTHLVKTLAQGRSLLTSLGLLQDSDPTSSPSSSALARHRPPSPTWSKT